MIAGLEEITEGEIMIGERAVNNILAKDRNIAMVFQNCALNPHLNVFNNMSFALKLQKVPKSEIKERVNNAARILNIEELLNRRPPSYPVVNGKEWRWEEPSFEIRIFFWRKAAATYRKTGSSTPKYSLPSL